MIEPIYKKDDRYLGKTHRTSLVSIASKELANIALRRLPSTREKRTRENGRFSTRPVILTRFSLYDTYEDMDAYSVNSRSSSFLILRWLSTQSTVRSCCPISHLTGCQGNLLHFPDLCMRIAKAELVLMAAFHLSSI